MFADKEAKGGKVKEELNAETAVGSAKPNLAVSDKASASGQNIMGRDHAGEQDLPHCDQKPRARRKAKEKAPMKKNFPLKLHEILGNPEFSHILSWLPHGRAWRIVRHKEFEEKVIPLYFRHGRYSSFARQVNGWGFRRIKHGTDYNAYYHDSFLRGLPQSCTQMKRVTSEDVERNKDDETPAPDFYALTRDNPLPYENQPDTGDPESMLNSYVSLRPGHSTSSLPASGAPGTNKRPSLSNMSLADLEKQRADILQRMMMSDGSAPGSAVSAAYVAQPDAGVGIGIGASIKPAAVASASSTAPASHTMNASTMFAYSDSATGGAVVDGGAWNASAPSASTAQGATGALQAAIYQALINQLAAGGAPAPPPPPPPLATTGLNPVILQALLASSGTGAGGLVQPGASGGGGGTALLIQQIQEALAQKQAAASESGSRSNLPWEPQAAGQRQEQGDSNGAATGSQGFLQQAAASQQGATSGVQIQPQQATAVTSQQYSGDNDALNGQLQQGLSSDLQQPVDSEQASQQQPSNDFLASLQRQLLQVASNQQQQANVYDATATLQPQPIQYHPPQQPNQPLSNDNFAALQRQLQLQLLQQSQQGITQQPNQQQPLSNDTFVALQQQQQQPSRQAGTQPPNQLPLNNDALVALQQQQQPGQQGGTTNSLHMQLIASLMGNVANNSGGNNNPS